MRNAHKLSLVVIAALLAGRESFAANNGVAAFQSADQKAATFLKDKTKTSYHRNWEMVIARFERIPKSYPGCDKAADALFKAGKLWLECSKLSGSSEDLKSAIADFERLAAKYPRSALADDALLLSGQVYLRLNDQQSAQKAFLKLSDLYPGSDSAAEARKYLGTANAGAAAKTQKPETEQSATELKPIFSSASGDEERPAAPAKAPLRQNDAIALLLGKNATVSGAATMTAVQLLNLRYWSAASYTRIALDLDRQAEFTAPRLLKPDLAISTPPRIYFDLINTRLSPGFRSSYAYNENCYEIPIGDGLLRRARAGQYRPDVVRVVLDLQSIREFRYFELPSGEDSRFRLVIDIYGEQKAAAPAPGLQPPAPTAPGVSGTPSRPEERPLQKTVIFILDPGHGGKDPGAIGRKRTREKDIVLAVALDLQKELRKKFPEAKIMLTRKDDRYLSLVERTAKANAIASNYSESQDVIFISLHCNASPDRSAAGIETYYLDNTADRAALRLAAQENFVSEEMMSQAGSYTNQILADLATTQKVNESIPLAGSIQRNLVTAISGKYNAVNNLGVKKAPFWVLTGAIMPSVLVELSFISHSQEERRLAAPSYRQALAKGVSEGVEEYLQKIESGKVITN